MFIVPPQSLFVGAKRGGGEEDIMDIIWFSKQIKCGVFLEVGTYLRRGF